MGGDDGRLLHSQDRATREQSPSGSLPSGRVSTDAGHTPLPWGPDTTINLRGPAISIGWLCSADPDSPSDLEARANAAFIVRACNSHYELLEALERIMLAAMSNDATKQHIAETAHAAITKARGQ